MNNYHSHPHPPQLPPPRPLPYEIVDIASSSHSQFSYCCQSTSCITITASPTHPLPLAWAKLLPCGCSLCRQCISRVITGKADDGGYTCVGCSSRAEQFGPLDLQVNTFRDFKSALSSGNNIANNTRQNQHIQQHQQENHQYHHHNNPAITYSTTSVPSIQNTPDLSMSIASTSATASPEIPFYPHNHNNNRMNQYTTPPYLSQHTPFQGQQKKEYPQFQQYGDEGQYPAQNYMGHQYHNHHIPSMMHENTFHPPPLPPPASLPAIQPITYPSLRDRHEKRITEGTRKEDRNRIASSSSSTFSSSSSSSHQQIHQPVQHQQQQQQQHERLQSYAVVAVAQLNVVISSIHSAMPRRTEEREKVNVGLGLSVPVNSGVFAEENQMTNIAAREVGVAQHDTRPDLLAGKSEEGKESKTRATISHLQEHKGETVSSVMTDDSSADSGLQASSIASSSSSLLPSLLPPPPTTTSMTMLRAHKPVVGESPPSGLDSSNNNARCEDRLIAAVDSNRDVLQQTKSQDQDQAETLQRCYSSSPSNAPHLSSLSQQPVATVPNQESKGIASLPATEPLTSNDIRKNSSAIILQEAPQACKSSKPLRTVSTSSSLAKSEPTNSINNRPTSSSRAYSSSFSSLNKRRPSSSAYSPTKQQGQKGTLNNPIEEGPSAGTTSATTTRHRRQTSQEHRNYGRARQYSHTSSIPSSSEKPYPQKTRRPSTSSVLSNAPGAQSRPAHYIPYEELAKASWGLDPWTDNGNAIGAGIAQLKDGSANKACTWPVLKITSISYHTTIADIRAFLPSGTLPPSSSDAQPIHMFTDFHHPDPTMRKKTLPYAYIECSSIEAALHLLTLSNEGKLGMLVGRNVYIKASTQRDLASNLWPKSLKYQMNGRPVNHMHRLKGENGDGLPFFTEVDREILEEMFEPYPPALPGGPQETATSISQQVSTSTDKNPQSREEEEQGVGSNNENTTRQRFNVYPRERPFTRLTGLLTKLPVHKAGLVDRATLDRLYGTLCSAITCIANGTEGLHNARDICEGLIKAGQGCTGFTQEQQLELEYAWKSIADMEISNLPSPASRIDFSKFYTASAHYDHTYGGVQARDRSTSYTGAYRTRSYTTNPPFSEPHRQRFSHGHERSSTTNSAVVTSLHPKQYKDYSNPRYTRVPSISSSSSGPNYHPRQPSLGHFTTSKPLTLNDQPHATSSSSSTPISSTKTPQIAHREVLRNYTNHIRGSSNASNASSTTIKSSSSSSMPGSGKYKVPAPRLAGKVRKDEVGHD